MVKRRAKKAGIHTPGICNHTFRSTGIMAYLENPEAKPDLGLRRSVALKRRLGVRS